MKRCIIIVVILLSLGCIFAQTPDFQWLVQVGSGDNDYGYDVCTDADGFVYQTGVFWGTVVVGDHTISAVGNRDMYVLKADNNGNVIWVATAGGSDSDAGNAVAVAPNGDVYVHGTFKATAMFGASTLVSGGYEDIYVAKLNSQGDWQWAISASTTSGDVAGKIALDSAGNVYVAGAVWGAAAFGDIYPTAYNYFDLFVAKASSSGNWLWAQTGGGSSDDKAYDIAVDADGNAFVVGSVMGSTTFGPFSYASNHYDVLVAKLDSAGAWQWISTSNGSSPEYGHSIALDPSGAIYVGGYYYNDGYFAPHFGTFYPVELGTQTMFVGRMSSSGSWIWVKGAGALQAPSGGSSQENKVFSLAVDSQANLWVTGVYQGTATFDSQQLPFIGGVDGFMGSMDGGGNWTSLESFGSAGADWSYGIALDAEDNVYLSGIFSATATFGDLSANAVNFYDSYLVKYGQSSASEPEITVNPEFLDYGQVLIGDTQSLGIEISNTGGAVLILSGVASSDPAVSAGLPGDLEFPIELAPEETQHIMVDFTPLAAQTYEGSIYVFSNDPVNNELMVPFIGFGNALAADFGASPASGTIPLEVQFTDLSEGNVEEWLWSFGDGTDSSMQNPIHTYTEPGTYSVSLTVWDGDLSDTITRVDYIEVSSEPMISSPQSAGVDFGAVWLGDSNTLQITLDSTGSADLVISSISLSGVNGEFSLTLPALPLTIDPGTQQEFGVTFSPSESILYEDTVTITSNAVNQPQLVIALSGEGQYIEPAMVQNVVVEISGDDALITWDPVTTSVEGSPLTPDRYIVLYNETPYEDDQYYYYLASTVENSFTHQEVALFRDQMFYRVVAVKFVRGETRDWLDGISPTDKISWERMQETLR